MPTSGCDATWSRLRAYYDVGEVLGRGATGLVTAARRKGDGREVAIKTLQPEVASQPELVQALEREARAGRTIRHPGVVPVLDQGRLADDTPYVAFALLRGDSLLHLLPRFGRLPSRCAAWIAERLARVLGAVHGAGFVHRDVKPEHIMLARDRERVRLYLIDFGICQAPDDEAAELERGSVFGTPGYLSPEQAMGERADARSDLYGVGAVLFEMLAGRPPFPSKNAARLLSRVLTEEPPHLEPSAELPAALANLTNRLLAREPAARPENARALSRLLAPLIGDDLEVERELARHLEQAPRSAASVPTRRLGPPSVQRILSAQG